MSGEHTLTFLFSMILEWVWESQSESVFSLLKTFKTVFQNGTKYTFIPFILPLPILHPLNANPICVKVQVLTKIIHMGCFGLHCVPSTLLPNSYVEILTPGTSECRVIDRVAADVISESEFTLDRVGLDAIRLVSLYKVETWTRVHRHEKFGVMHPQAQECQRSPVNSPKPEESPGADSQEESALPTP